MNTFESNMAAPIDTGKGANMEKQHKYCEIEATVTTGFENIAKEEVEEKFGVEAAVEKGHITFTIPVSDVDQVLGLTTVDNLFVILQHKHDFQFKEEKAEALDQIGDLVPNIDWDLGLKIWHRFSDYPKKVSHLPLTSQHLSQSTDGLVNGNHSDSADQSLVEKVCDSLINNEVSEHSKILIKDGSAIADAEVTQNNNTNDTSSPDAEPKKKVRRTCHGYPDLPSFRVTCYRSSGEHCFSSMEAASHFGSKMQDYFGWNVSMKDFDIEAVLFVQANHVYIGIALTKESLHRRHISYLGPTPLKPTTACGMLRFCKIQPGEVVCDPMCGGGTIPIQAATFWPQAQHVCGEIHDMAVDRCNMNIEAVNTKRHLTGRPTMNLDMMKWDAMKLPLSDNSVDVFVTDLPFGKRSGSKMRNWHLYPRVLIEMARTSKMNTGRACLLTQDKKCIIKTLQVVSEYWRRGNTLWVNIGGLAAGVFLLHRTNKMHNMETTKKMLQNCNK